MVRWWRLGALIASTTAVQGCAGAPQRSFPPAPPREAAASAESAAQAPTDNRWRADLTFNGKRWRVDYRFPKTQSALLFDSAHGDYRTTHWSPLESWVTLERLEGLDGAFFAKSSTSALFDIDPPQAATEGTLAIVPFSDGTYAFWAGQLALLTVESRDAALALHGDLRKWHGEQPEIEVEVNSDVQLIGVAGVGKHFVGSAHHGHGPYFYTGTSEDPMLVVDPGLPDWVKSAFRTRMPEVQAALEQRWTQKLPRPQLMLAWGGGVGDWSNRGRAEGRQIVMRIQGAAYLQRDLKLLGDLVWFFAHEMSHLHQFADGGEGEPWMIEGFADTLATEVLVRIGLWDKGVLERRYWSVARECARELSKGPLASARGRVTYVCGDLVGVALMQLIPSGNIAQLWVEARRGTGRVTRKRLLQVAKDLGANDAGVAAIDAFVANEHADTDGAIRTLLESAKLKPIYTKGSLSSLAFPFGK